jgi:diguanylate cyclase (GGDEF)-like protein
MHGTHQPELVALSIAVAILASYTTLNVAARVGSASSRAAKWWLLGGAAALGSGVWSMHFIGMLACKLPFPVAFDVEITVLSFAIAVVSSGLALVTLKPPRVRAAALAASAAIIGAGIAAMHYTGMMALRMAPPIVYAPDLFVLSIVVAIAAAWGALKLAFRLRFAHSAAAAGAKLGGAIVLGLAISGMHYIGMAAAHFSPGSVSLAAQGGFGVDNAGLAVIVGASSVLILLTTLALSAYETDAAARSARLAETLRRANHDLQSVAFVDPLTGLPNRVLLQDRAQQALHRAERSNTRVAVMFIDLDGFKTVNDTYGHATGDALLRRVAQRLQQALRKQDTVARLGGDEFVAIVPEIETRDEAAAVGNKLMAALGKPLQINDVPLSVSGSIGIGLYPDDGRSAEDLLQRADAAMYRVKQRGRCGIEFYSSRAA